MLEQDMSMHTNAEELRSEHKENILKNFTKTYPITGRTTETGKDEENRYLSEDRRMDNIQKCSEFVPEKR